MSYHDVLAILLSAQEEQVLRAAELTAGKTVGRVTALHVFEMPMLAVSDGAGATVVWPQILEQTRTDALAEQKKIRLQLKALEPNSELRTLETPRALAGEGVGQQAMHADIAVMQAPRSDLSIAAFEGALFNSGRPVILTPPSWRGDSLGENILIAWKPTREAARAVADAAPFINAAKNVTVLCIDAMPGPYGQRPGHDIATHLARDGAHVDVRNVSGQGRFPETAIIDEARALGADLIVIGGYGHGRLREFVLGGVTRSLSRDCPIPILMSH
ncbi:MAG: universal stress protein [Proteobacteria bacterium]|nr:universal stress protein [Pseudomonadota bacterium]